MNSSMLFNVTTIMYMVSMIVFFAFLASKSKAVGLTASLVAYGGWTIQTTAILLRWKESYDLGRGHAPLSNLFESVVFFAWTIILIYGIIEVKYASQEGSHTLAFDEPQFSYVLLSQPGGKESAKITAVEAELSSPRHGLCPTQLGTCRDTLRGYLLASNEKGGSKISYIFDVTDAKGTRVARVSGDELVPGKAADPWDAVNGTVLNTIAGKTTSQLAASLPHGGAKSVMIAMSPMH